MLLTMYIIDNLSNIISGILLELVAQVYSLIITPLLSLFSLLSQSQLISVSSINSQSISTMIMDMNPSIKPSLNTNINIDLLSSPNFNADVIVPFQFQFQQVYRNCTEILYIDCRNWFDFSQQLLSVTLAFILFLKVAKHYRNLKKQKQQNNSEHQKSVRRKIAINLLIILYLLFFICNTIFDMYLYFMYKQAQTREILYGTLDKIYKISEVVYINMLNALNLAVGLLYWKATRAYYVLSELEVPKLYRRAGKYVFVLFFVNIASAVCMAPMFLFVFHGNNQQNNRDFAIFTLVSTSISIIVCIGCRIMYRRHILTKIQMSSSAVSKQRLISFLLFTSSTLRLAIYSLDIGIPSWSQQTRNQQLSQQNGQCKDLWAYYAFILLGINFIVNLLPAAVYGHLFVSEVDYRLKGSIKEGLRERGRRLFRSKDNNQNNGGGSSRKGSGNLNSNGNNSQVIENQD